MKAYDPQGKDAAVVITREEDVALLTNLVMKEKEIVMDLMMVVGMMVMRGAETILYVEATIARSLVVFITKRTTVVSNLLTQQLSNQKLFCIQGLC